MLVMTLRHCFSLNDNIIISYCYCYIKNEYNTQISIQEIKITKKKILNIILCYYPVYLYLSVAAVE